MSRASTRTERDAPAQAPDSIGACGVSLAVLERRAALHATLRATLAERGFLEIDGALLSPAAPAERALDCFEIADAGWLVPSPEHGLKRIVAQTRRDCFQLGHVFRAGEVGRWHNPEFTMLEWYRQAATMADAIATLDTLLQNAGTPAITRVARYAEVFCAATGIDPRQASAADLAAHARTLGVAPAVDAAAEPGDRVYWLDLLMALVVQPTLGQHGPEVVTHFPSDDAVLVALDDDARCARRFECFWQGIELANGAEESTDAKSAEINMQREQNARAAAGRCLPPLDERLLAAMRMGLPACAGVALGVDRLLALLLESDSLASVIPFSWPLR